MIYPTHPDYICSLLKDGQITSKQADDWEAIAKMSENAFESLLKDWFPGGIYRQPGQWLDSAFNNLIQPVVGISWFEVLAYGTWLSAQTGLNFQLPSEAQWEAAARGFSKRAYAWGEKFEAQQCNSFESHIRATTPVGLFIEGNTPDNDLADISGSVWEWTRSLYHKYPYETNDGRENPNDSKSRRVVRGGSWFNGPRRARCACRGGYFPDLRDNNLGFRLSCVSPIH